ncbi:glycoside hydrolase family 99-like domain-containing protein [Niabella aurantiaca]|uniref:glycoside hydrolase family 99-like domain-containing protein n=1 Tax=Niabella aurantiaca TaxID=379900 RepID=UPI00035CB3B0
MHAQANKIVTVDAWNEWTEGSYLAPDTKNKMKYLDPLRDVFGRDRPGTSAKRK